MRGGRGAPPAKRRSKISLKCPHNPQELEYLLKLSEGARTYLEIGCRYGECLALMGKGKRVVVAVDLPGGPWGYPDSQGDLERHAASVGAHLFLGNSTDPAIVEKVKALGPYDLIFIDGDHNYEGAKKDWENYGPLGKVVVFHDIIHHPDENERPYVWKLWQEITGNKKEFIGVDSVMGLGIWSASI